MKLVICVSDYEHQRQWYRLQSSQQSKQGTSYSIEIIKNLPIPHQLVRRQNAKKESEKNFDPVSAKLLRRLKLDVDGITYFYLLKEILKFTTYRETICRYSARHGVQLLWLQIVPPVKETIDWKWHRMLAYKLWEKIETDYLMSWLSTLGGGYSALGEEFTSCAEVAGKISKKQLRIGILLGDPYLQARCFLYYSISLIQVDRLRAAKLIIRQQYLFAKAHEEIDTRLVKMCEGIWFRLQYEYGRRLHRNNKLDSNLER